MQQRTEFVSPIPPTPGEHAAASSRWKRSGVLGRLVRLDGDPGDAAAVLVVDDEPALRGLFASILHRRGFAAVTAASADEALEAARSRRLSLVISDYALGPKNGLDLLAELRPEQPQLPFVLTSVAFPDGVVEQARGAGVDLVTEKAALLDDLGGTADRLVGRAA
jgi:DNA-binding NtrC family response regulator